MTRISIGARLKLLRAEKRLTQKELAHELNISTSAIGMYETDKAIPNPVILQSIADYFNVSIDYLCGNTDIREKIDTIGELVKSIAGDPELMDCVKALKDRQDVKVFFKQTKDLSPETLKQVLTIINIIDKAETRG